MSRSPSPLLAVGIQFALDAYPELTKGELELLETSLGLYLSGHITFKDCSNMFVQVVRTKKPLSKILQILQTPEQPIPPTIMSNKGKSVHWTSYEDRRLLAAVHRYGLESWGMVANFVGNRRTKSQCAQRWNRGLNPMIKREKWTEEETQKLLELVNSRQFRSWSSIAAKMGNRSDVQCRYHYKQITGSSDDKLMMKSKINDQFSNSDSDSSTQQDDIAVSPKIMLPSITEMIAANHMGPGLVPCMPIFNINC